MMVIPAVIGTTLGLDLIDVKTGKDKVTYVYRTTGFLARKKIQEIKAIIASIFSFPADIPVDIRIYPEKKGILVKSFIVEVDVQPREFELKGAR